MKNVMRYFDCGQYVGADGERMSEFIRNMNNAILQSLVNLGRFHDCVMMMRESNGVLLNGQYDRFVAYADDFFHTWSASSTELIAAIGKDAVVELLRVFKRYWTFAWPVQAEVMMEAYLEAGVDICVYRGGNPATLNESLSWTTSEGIAEWYAGVKGDGVLATGTVRLCDILYVNNSEYEIVVEPGSVEILNITHHGGVP